MTAVAATMSSAPLPQLGTPGGAATLEMALPGFAAVMAAALPGNAPVMIDDAVPERPPEASPVLTGLKPPVNMPMTGAVSGEAETVAGPVPQVEVTDDAGAGVPVAALPQRRCITPEATVMSQTGGKRANADGTVVRRRVVPTEPFEPAAAAPIAPLAVVTIAGPAKAVPVGLTGAKSPPRLVSGADLVAFVSERPDALVTGAGEAAWRHSVDAALQRVAQPAATLVPWIMAGMPPVAAPLTGRDVDAWTALSAVLPVPAIARAEPIVAPADVALPGLQDIAGARDDESGGPESFLPSPRFALAVLDAISARSPASDMVSKVARPLAGLAGELAPAVLPMVFERGEGDAPGAIVLADLPAGSQFVATAPATPAVAMAVRGDVPEPPAARPVSADVTVAATTPQLGEVRIGLDGSAQALRVTLTVGSGAASVLADAPRLAADLAANGLRLQALEVGDAGSALPTGGGASWNAPAGGEGRPRFVPPQTVAANAFANEQAALLPSRARPASDRYA